MTNHEFFHERGANPSIPLVQALVPSWNGASLLPYATMQL
jgi:hypothetical protein